jgi:hypothetical protein
LCSARAARLTGMVVGSVVVVDSVMVVSVLMLVLL